MRKKYTFDKLTPDDNRVFDIDPYVSYFYENINNKTTTYSFRSFLDKNISNELLKYCSLYVSNAKTSNSKRAGFNHLTILLNYFLNNNIYDINDFNYKEIYDYRTYLHEKSKKVSANRYYQTVISFLKFLLLNNYKNLNDDILNLDIPKALKTITKTSFEKDLEHYNKSVDFNSYSLLICELKRLLINNNCSNNEKILAYMGIISCLTGANPEVIKAFTFKDILLISQSIDFTEIIKVKNKKGFDCHIKVLLKNHILDGIKLSEISSSIYNQIKLIRNANDNDLFFMLDRARSFILVNNYNELIRNLIHKYQIDFKDNFTFSAIRKTYERHIYGISKNIVITSTLMGHTKNVAKKNYLNTSAGIEGHQKLGLTQDIIKGFSKSNKTDNFVVYQKLLNLYDLDLEKALDLSNKGFPIEDIIKQARRN